MTIANPASRWPYLGNGATTVFPYTAKIFFSSDLRVEIDDVLQTSGYTVSGVGSDAGGNVTITPPPLNGAKVLIRIFPPIGNDLDISNLGDFDPQAIENQFDKEVNLIKMLAERLDRALTLPASTSVSQPTLPEPVALKVWRWKADLSGIEYVDVFPSGTIGIPVSFLQGGTNGAYTTALALAQGLALGLWKKGADIAAASDLTLPNPLDGNLFTVSGAGDINSISTGGINVGTRISVLFTGTPRLISSVVLGTPGNVNYQVVANDLIDFQHMGVSLWRVVRIVPATTSTGKFQRDDGVFATPPVPLYTDQLTGLGLSNNVADATNDIDIAIGAAASDDVVIANRVLMILAAVLTKRLDAVWAVGTNQGGLDIGTIADGTYHTWLIQRPDTGVVDALFSRNPGRAATFTVTIASPGVVTMVDHGLQVGSSFIPTTTGALPTGLTAGTRYFVISAGLTDDAFQVSATEGGAAINTTGTQSGVHTATADPVLPTGYTKKRRLGSPVRVSAALKPFTQTGDWVEWSTKPLDVNATNPGTAAVLRAMTVPIGHRFDLQVNIILVQPAANQLYLSSPYATDEAPSLTAAPLGTQELGANLGGDAATGGVWRGITSHAGKIRTRVRVSDGSTIVRLAPVGYFDRRGKG